MTTTIRMPYQMYFLFPFPFLSCSWEKNNTEQKIILKKNSEEQQNQTSKKTNQTTKTTTTTTKTKQKNLTEQNKKKNKPIRTACLHFHWPSGWFLGKSQICEHDESSVAGKNLAYHPHVWSHSALHISKLGLVQAHHMTKKRTLPLHPPQQRKESNWT